MASPSVTVVICAHRMDRLDDLQAAIASVTAQTRPADEMILVIDHNNELQQAVAGLGPKVVPNVGTKGLSGARNTGTELAMGDVVAYLDDDAIAEPTWLEELVAPFDDPAVVAVGGSARPAWETERPGWFPDEYLWVVGCSHRGVANELVAVRNVIGCSMAFRRQAVLDAGGFDEGLGRTAEGPLGCEETELCIRLRQTDPSARILLQPLARVDHRVPAERTTWRYFVDRCRAEGRSKAQVVGLVGPADGLSSEWSYVASVLPAAIGRSLAGLPRRPLSSLGAVLAIVGGLVVTAFGFLEGKIAR